MFKNKVLVILISVLLLSSNVGLSFTLHFCKGNFATLVFDNFSNSNSTLEDNCCKKVQKSSCCSDKTVEIKKITSEKIISEDLQLNLSDFVFIQNRQIAETPRILLSNFTQQGSDYYCAINAPPFYKLYSQLIFYD